MKYTFKYTAVWFGKRLDTLKINVELCVNQYVTGEQLADRANTTTELPSHPVIPPTMFHLTPTPVKIYTQVI